MTKTGSNDLVSGLTGSEEKLSFVPDSALCSSTSSLKGILAQAGREEFKIIAVIICNYPSWIKKQDAFSSQKQYVFKLGQVTQYDFELVQSNVTHHPFGSMHTQCNRMISPIFLKHNNTNLLSRYR